MAEARDTVSETDAPPFSRLARAGLELAGVPASPEELAVMEAADRLYRPLLDTLLEADMTLIEPELDADLSRPPSA